MKLTDKEKRIIKDDILGLKEIIKYYEKQGKYEKARECEIELEKLERKLRGEK